ncbi:MAG: carboxypeptidase regulatory-like domain-containing protein [Acidobacteriota bacterium]
MRISFRSKRSIGVFFGQFLLLTTALLGQATITGSLRGTVRDASGASVPGADVTLVNTATGRSQSAVTSETGFYNIAAVPGGVYEIRVTLPGFATHVAPGVKIDSAEVVTHNVVLQVGEVATEVMVEAEPVKVNTATGEISGVISQEQVENLQLNGRNFLGLLMLEAGVNNVRGANQFGGGGLTTEVQASVNGLGREMNNYTIDGGWNMNTGNMVNVDVTPPLDSIQEVKVVTNSFSARYGISGSANVMVETRSGTQAFHGSVYEFVRNDVFDARNVFSPEKTSLRFNNFGYSIGGPVFIPGVYNESKDKTFFFWNHEFRRVRQGGTLLGATPTSAMRSGDFTPDGVWVDEAPVDPETGEPFPGNRIPQERMDPNALLLLDQIYPAPNRPASEGFLNFINTGSDKTDQDNEVIRVDHYISDRLNIMARYLQEDVMNEPPAMTWGANPFPTLGQTIDTFGKNAMIRATMTLNPTTINTLGVTSAQTVVYLLPQGAWHRPSGLNLNHPFPNADDRFNRIPQVSFAGGWSGFGVHPFPLDHASDLENVISDDFSTTVGNHVLEMGGFFIFGTKRQDLFSQTNGTYFFSGKFSGDPIADYLLGLSSSFFQHNNYPRGYHHYRHTEIYFQDDWKFNSRLSLNLGIRYHWVPPDFEEGNRVSNFDLFGRFNPYDPAKAPIITDSGVLIETPNYDPLNGIAVAGRNGVPRGFSDSDQHFFGPRIGFAVDLTGDGRTALRGGYGLGYFRIPFRAYNALNNPPFGDSLSFLDAPFSDPAAGAAAPRGAPVITSIDWNYRPSAIHTYNLSVEHQRWDTVWTVRYAGSQSRNLSYRMDWNYPLAPEGFDFDPRLNRFEINANAIRPFVGYAGIVFDQWGGNANYNSFQFQARKPIGRYLGYTVAYTWGHALSDVGNRGFDFRFQTGSIQDPFNRAAEYGPTSIDRRHMLTFSYMLNVPGFQNIRNAVVRNVLGGWQLTGITTAYSGFPISPGLATGQNGLAQRPHLVGDPNTGPKRREQWFNTAAFAEPAPGFFGNSGNGTILTPGEFTWHMALYKNFDITEDVRLQFRSEFFNIFNHTNFFGVNASLGSGAYGQVTSAQDPRIIQFGFRLDF